MSSRRVKFAAPTAPSVAKSRPARSRAVTPGAASSAAASETEEDAAEDESADDCAFCGEGGLVLICDVKTCRRVYHAPCLGFEPAATDTFVCPAHFCALCAQPDRAVVAASDVALAVCATCPTAFCPRHTPDDAAYARAAALAVVPPTPAGFFAGVFSTSPLVMQSVAAGGGASSVSPTLAAEGAGGVSASAPASQGSVLVIGAAAGAGASMAVDDAVQPAGGAGGPLSSPPATATSTGASTSMRKRRRGAEGSDAAGAGADEGAGWGGAAPLPPRDRQRARTAAVEGGGGVGTPGFPPGTHAGADVGSLGNKGGGAVSAGAAGAACGGNAGASATASSAVRSTARTGTKPFACHNCAHPTARVRLARALEAAWAHVMYADGLAAAGPPAAPVEADNAELSPLLTATLFPLSDTFATPIYLSSGYSPRDLGIAAPSATSPSSAPAISHRVNSAATARRVLVNVAAGADPRWLAAAMRTGSAAAAARSGPPACFMDILERARACVYSSAREFIADARRVVQQIGVITGAAVGSLPVGGGATASPSRSTTTTRAAPPSPAWALSDKGEGAKSFEFPLDDAALHAGVLRSTLPLPLIAGAAPTSGTRESAAGATGVSVYHAALTIADALERSLLRGKKFAGTVRDAELLLARPPPPPAFELLPALGADALAAAEADAGASPKIASTSSARGTNGAAISAPRLASALGIEDDEAMRRILAARLSHSRPETLLPPRGTPFFHRKSLAEAAADISGTAPRRRVKDAKIEAASRAAAAARPPIILGGGAVKNPSMASTAVVAATAGAGARAVAVASSGHALVSSAGLPFDGIFEAVLQRQRAALKALADVEDADAPSALSPLVYIDGATVAADYGADFAIWAASDLVRVLRRDERRRMSGDVGASPSALCASPGGSSGGTTTRPILPPDAVAAMEAAVAWSRSRLPPSATPFPPGLGSPTSPYSPDPHRAPRSHAGLQHFHHAFVRAPPSAAEAADEVALTRATAALEGLVSGGAASGSGAIDADALLSFFITRPLSSDAAPAAATLLYGGGGDGEAGAAGSKPPATTVSASTAAASGAAAAPAAAQSGSDGGIVHLSSGAALVLLRASLAASAKVASHERTIATLADAVSDLQSQVSTACATVARLAAALDGPRRVREMEGSGGGGAGAGADEDEDRLTRLFADVATSAADRAAGFSLASLAGADDAEAFGGGGGLRDLLPPAPHEMTDLFDAASRHARKSLLALAELRSAWAASRRSYFAVPARVDTDQRLLARAGLVQEAVDAPEGAAGAVFTLGEGRVALEFAAANAALRARVRVLEVALAAKG